ncbi:putative thymidylate kinase [Dirofilaria immitis]
MTVYVLLLILSILSAAEAIQCYSGSQIQIIECPSINCIKHSIGFDTIKYCDGTGGSSICQTIGPFIAKNNIVIWTLSVTRGDQRMGNLDTFQNEFEMQKD